mmetsp:Transcript_26541/g.67549  ORF Transcript_26541/g.67549 Transcript_26541/m.67549 type:complete len:87 (-) Transcript_26541:3062-3322(-)
MSLLLLSIDTIAAHIERYKDLSRLPEEICALLFERVLELGKLNPKVLAVFTATQHGLVLARIKALNLRDTPPVLPDADADWRKRAF